MAKVRSAYTTRDARGNREDLSDQIYNIDPFDTPMFNSAGRRNVTNVTYDWQTEKLPAVNGDNAKVEGFELQRSTGTPTQRQANVSQISSRDATVSGSQENADAAGRPSEMGAQMALQSKALKRDMETIMSSSQPLQRGDETTPRKTRGLLHWLKTNAFLPQAAIDAGATLPASETDPYPTVDSANRIEFTEEVLGAMMQQTYDQGAEVRLMVAGPSLKRTMSGFKGRDNAQVTMAQTVASFVVDIYVSDFGRLKAIPSRWVDPNVVFLLDPSYLKATYYRSLRTVPIAKIGDAETRMILAEWGVQVSNEAAHAALIGAKPNPNLSAEGIAVGAA